MEANYAKQRIINDIETNDIKIQVTGFVKEKKDNEEFILDDKSGQIRVLASNIEKKIPEVDDLVNVFGELEIKTNGEKVLNAYIIQDMNKLNFDYYLKLYDLKKDLK
ncbi:MAG: hypothetical protein P8Y70_09240 [Candidatus Lokiarchaeota archaeon]